MKLRGFTIVEVSVVIVLIVVITTLGVASLRSSQISARDDERQVKAETLARALESFYRNGDPSRGINPGRYPTGVELSQAISGGYITEWLDNSDSSFLRFSWQNTGENNIHILGTTKTPERDITEDPARIQSAVNTGKLVYEPMAIYKGSIFPGDTDPWSSCYNFYLTYITTCNRYNIYYKKESDNTIVTIRSERQQ